MNKHLLTPPIAASIAVSPLPRIFCFLLIALATLFVGKVYSQTTLYWRTDGSASQSWTGTNWSTTATATGGTGWTSAANAIFSANSTPIFVTNQQVGNITLTGTTTTVTMTKAGTFATNGKIITIDVCSGCIFNWGSQLVSTATGTGFKKTSAGTWNIGGSINSTGAPAGITINAGTVIVTSVNSFGGGAISINGGTLQSTGNAFNFSTLNLGGNFTLSGTGTDTYGMPTVLTATPTITNSTSSSAIRQLTGGISGSFGLTFNGAGAGVITMGGINSFTGAVTLSADEVGFASDACFGAIPSAVTPASIIIDGGKMTAVNTDNSTTVNYTLDSKRGIQVGTTAGTTINVNFGSTLIYNGVIADKPSVAGAWTKQGGGTLILGGASTYTGATTLNNGTLQLAANALPATTLLSLGQASSTNLGILDMNGNNQTIAGLISVSGTNGTVTKNTITSTGAATLTINSSTTNAYGNGTTTNSGVITGAVSIIKSGTGTQTLADVNTYTGTTTVVAGTLNINSTGSLSASSAVTVTTNGTLSGTGMASGSVDLSGTISPAGAMAMGTLTTGNLTLEGGGFYHFDVNKTTGTAGIDWDKLVVGTLTNSATAGFNFTVAINGTIASFVSANTYNWVIGTYTGTAPSIANITVNAAGITNSFSGTFSIGFASNNINLIYTTCTAGTWMGANTAWATNTNWCASTVPTGATNVTIPVSSLYPTISTTAPINNLTIASGASLTVTGTLQVAGSITNGGTLDITGGMLELNGSSAQTIQGSVFNNSTIGGLKINNSAGVTISSQLNITDSIVPALGTLTTGGFLTLKSSSTKTARIAAGAGSYLLGNVTVERYITAKTARRYSFIGSPVTQSIRNTWQQQLYITGSGTGGVVCGSTTGNGGSTDKYNTNGFDATASNAKTILTYTAATTNGSHYVGMANTSTNLVAGTGYSVNIRGDRNSATNGVTCYNQLNSGSPVAPESVTLNATGTLTTGNLSVALNDISIHAFTLLANPYPSQISFFAFQASNSIINNKMWMFSPFGSGNFSTYANGHIANGAAGYDDTYGNNIASGQAFFVEANTNGSVTFAEAHKTNGAIPNTQYFGTAEKSIRIGLYNSGNIRLDEILLIYSKMGSTQYNQQLDAISFSLTSQALVSYKGTIRLAIAEMPDTTAANTTQLGVSSKTGAYSMAFDQTETIDNTQTVTMLDRFLGVAANMRSNPTYHFNVTTDTASKGSSRFKVVLGGANTLPVNFMRMSATQNIEGVLVRWQVANDANIASYQVEKSTEGVHFTSINTNKAIGATTYSIQDASLPTGTNTLYYRIKSTDKDERFCYSNVAVLKLSIVNCHLSIFPNLIQNKLNITLTGAAIGNLYKVKIATATGKIAFSMVNVPVKANLMVLNVESLAAGMYEIEFTDGKGNKLIDKFIKL